MKRFYKNVGVEAVSGGYEVRLDGRPLRTPAKAPLVLAREELARAIAAEWEAQGEQIKPDSMPMMQLASTAIDRVAPNRNDMVCAVAAYGQTDLLCYRAEHPPALAERQARLWQPLLDWAMLRYDANLVVNAGIMPRPQPPEALRALRSAVEAYDDLMLSALQVATSACGSLVVALALMEGRIEAEQAFDISQLDETFQIEEWGEDAEAVQRRANVKAEIQSCRRFVDLLRG